MIVCKLMGGLGNQMFQYAYAMALSAQFGEEICLDTGFYHGKAPAIMELCIPHRGLVKEYHLSDYNRAIRKEQYYHILQKLMRSICHERVGNRIFQKYASQGYYFNFDPFYYPSPMSVSEHKYIYGYFQSEKYFEPVRTEVRKAFVPWKPMSESAVRYAELMEGTEAVAVHIRLGDYTRRKNRYLYVCTDQYYRNAITYIYEHVSNPCFFIFTNDIRAVQKKDYLHGNMIYIEETKDTDAMMLMSLCRYFIISNSTFSWWGAYLSGSERKMTVAPEQWIRTAAETPAIYLDEMITVSCG